MDFGTLNPIYCILVYRGCKCFKVLVHLIEEVIFPALSGLWVKIFGLQPSECGENSGYLNPSSEGCNYFME